MRITTLVAAAALGAAVLAGCGGGGGSDADRQDLIDQMVDEGATEEQANCVADELGDDLDRMINSDESELSEEDMQRVVEATMACVDLDELLDPDTTG